MILLRCPIIKALYSSWDSICFTLFSLNIICLMSCTVHEQNEKKIMICFAYLKCDYSNQASWSKVHQSKIYLRTKDGMFSNKSIALMNMNNRS